MAFVRVASADDIPEGEGRVVNANGTPVALFKVNGSFHAIHNTCLHKGGPLGEGFLDGTIVTCPWHGWQYDVTTGRNVMSPSMAVKKFDVKVEGNDVLVDV